MAAARAKLDRIQRGAVTLEIMLAIGQPSLMVQTPVNVSGCKPDIDGMDWLCKTMEHSLGDNGLVTRLELELRGQFVHPPLKRGALRFGWPNPSQRKGWAVSVLPWGNWVCPAPTPSTPKCAKRR